MKIIKQKSFFRTASYFFQRWILRREFLFANVNTLGLIFKVKTQDVVGRHIYKYHAHEPKLSAWLIENIQPTDGDVYIDIGANIGWYSLLFSKIAKPKSSIFSFEPDPLNSSLLRQNIEINRVDSIDVIEAAISESAGKAKLYRYSSSNLGRHSMLHNSNQDSLEVNTIGLDEFWRKQNLAQRFIRVLKIDVEGYEYFALKSGGDVLKKCGTVLCEYSPDIMREHGISPEALLKLFFDAGLYPWKLAEGSLIPFKQNDLLAASGVLDIIWTREQFKN